MQISRRRTINCNGDKVFSMRIFDFKKTESNKAVFDEHKSDITFKVKVSRK